MPWRGGVLVYQRVARYSYGPIPLISNGRHGHFLNPTCVIGPRDM